MTSEEFIPFSEVERDALCELANVAMARAAASLRQMVGHQILLTVPTCDITAREKAIERLLKSGNSNLVAVRQDFSGPFWGRALLIFEPCLPSPADRPPMLGNTRSGPTCK
jgi:chemotaxis protein CheC